MRLTGRRESNNVDDRRGMGMGTKAGIGGIGGIILIALITFLSGGDMGDVVNNVLQQELQGPTEVQTGGQQHQFSAEEEKLADFSKQILAGTEDVWTEQFQLHGMRYQYPTLVLYTGAVQTACGDGSAAMGPFYCSADQRLYLDLSFFSGMRKDLGLKAKGDLDFAYAYVVTHLMCNHVGVGKVKVATWSISMVFLGNVMLRWHV